MNANDMTADDLVLSLYLQNNRGDDKPTNDHASTIQYSDSNNFSYGALGPGGCLLTGRTDELGPLMKKEEFGAHLLRGEDEDTYGATKKEYGRDNNSSEASSFYIN